MPILAEWTGDSEKSKLHEHLRSWRHHKQLNIMDFARLVGWKYHTYFRRENGKRPLRLYELEHIANILGVHPALLLFHPDDAFKIDLPAYPKPAEQPGHPVRPPMPSRTRKGLALGKSRAKQKKAKRVEW